MDQLSLPIKALKEVRPEGSAHGAAVLPRPAHMLRISVSVPSMERLRMLLMQQIGEDP